MKTVTERPMSLEEFDALPETVLPRQLVEGQLIMALAPDRFHQSLVGILHGELYAWVRMHPGQGELYIAPFDVQLPGLNVYQPDVMFFRHDHLDRLTDQRALGAPDLAVEVLSPSTAHYDLNEKRLHYGKSGVGELWIVNPKRKHVQVYLLGQEVDRPVRFLKAGLVLTTDLLPGFELPLDRLFR
ncbi:MAG TPA: Uma2 family endonuclease [Chthoniobacterales bacterium]